jgi:hypothetical protein
MCRSTCFGRLHAHHQELTTALTTSGFTLECGGSSVVGRGLAGQIMTNNAATTTSVYLFDLYDDARTCQRKKKSFYMFQCETPSSESTLSEPC